MSRNAITERAEDILLAAESLERQMTTQGATTEGIELIGDLIAVAQELFAETRESGDTR